MLLSLSLLGVAVIQALAPGIPPQVAQLLELLIALANLVFGNIAVTGAIKKAFAAGDVVIKGHGALVLSWGVGLCLLLTSLGLGWIQLPAGIDPANAGLFLWPMLAALANWLRDTLFAPKTPAVIVEVAPSAGD